MGTITTLLWGEMEKILRDDEGKVERSQCDKSSFFATKQRRSLRIVRVRRQGFQRGQAEDEPAGTQRPFHDRHRRRPLGSNLGGNGS